MLFKKIIFSAIIISLLTIKLSAYDAPDEFFDRLGKLETRGEHHPYQAVQKHTGCLGKYQIGEGMLIDLGYMDKHRKWTGKHDIHSKKDFLNSEKIQEKVIRKEFALNKKYIINHLKEDYNLSVKDLSDIDKRYSEFGVLGAAHLIGAKAVCRTYSSKNHRLRLSKIKDEIGTSARKYAKKLTNLEERLSEDISDDSFSS